MQTTLFALAALFAVASAGSWIKLPQPELPTPAPAPYRNEGIPVGIRDSFCSEATNRDACGPHSECVNFDGGRFSPFQIPQGGCKCREFFHGDIDSDGESCEPNVEEFCQEVYSLVEKPGCCKARAGSKVVVDNRKTSIEKLMSLGAYYGGDDYYSEYYQRYYGITLSEAQEKCAERCEEEQFCTAYQLQPIAKARNKAKVAAWVHGQKFDDRFNGGFGKGLSPNEQLQGTNQYDCQLFVTPITSTSRKHRSCRSTVCATKVCDEEEKQKWLIEIGWLQAPTR